MTYIKRELYRAILRRQLLFFEHVTREKDLGKKIMMSLINGKRVKRRQTQT